MNHVYRLKRSGRTQQLQAVPETARAAGKGTRTGTTLAQTVTGTLASFALSGIASLAYAQQAPPASAPTATQLPQGGVVTRGSANIVTNTGQAQLTVNQSSSRAVIDWTSFNVGSQAKVQFNQPSASAVTLNNILGNNASQIYGQISANGQVFLSNPNGVYFSPTAQVNVGGLVATTGKANADEFMAGKAVFNRDGSTGSVVNQGQLTSAAGGYIALLAPEVRNQGVVVAQAGTVALASGEAITLHFNHTGTGLAGITTTPQAIAALVENRSAVVAEGGQIILSAHALASLQGSVVKNSGQLSATSLSTQGGKIVLMGDSIELTGTSQIQASGATGGGTVLVGGDWQGTGDMRQATRVTMAQGASIQANATGRGDGGKVVLWSDVNKVDSVTAVHGSIQAEAGPNGGDGGHVETSGHRLSVIDIHVSTQAKAGNAGEWLLDPVDFTIADSGGDITGTALGALLTGNVTIQSNSGTAGTGGHIHVNDAVSWSANKLTLNAQGSVYINAVMTATGTASLALNYGLGAVAAGNTSVIKTKMGPNDTFIGKINLPAGTTNFTTTQGSNGTTKAYTVITSLGAVNSSTTTDLQGINGGATLNYVLGADIDATATSGWSSGAGFMPLKSSGFAGTLNGLGHIVSNLTINRPTGWYVGLFDSIGSGGIVENLGLTSARVNGSLAVGTIAGRVRGSGTVRNTFSSGTVSSTGGYVGGLVGQLAPGMAPVQTGLITESYSSADVTFTVGTGSTLVGGLVGWLQTGTITKSYASGRVSSTGYDVGGLVGLVELSASATFTVTDNYALGAVSGRYNIGGLIGRISSNNLTSGSKLERNFSNNTVSGTSSPASVAGLVGDGNILFTRSNNYWNTDISGKSVGMGSATGTAYNQTGFTGLSSAQMLVQSNFSGFDFTSSSPVWTMPSGGGPPVLCSLQSSCGSVQLYLLPTSGQSHFYGSAPASLSYCYSSSASSCVSVSYAGIPSANQTFTLTNGAVSKTESVGGSAITGTLALTGSPSIASTGLVATTNAGSYALTLTPALTLAGYTFLAGNAVNYAVNKADLTLVTASKVYDGLSTVRHDQMTSIAGVLGQSFSATAGTATISDKNVSTVGKTLVDLSGLTLASTNGGIANNYNLNTNLPLAGSSNNTVNVTAAPMTISGITANNKVYNGNTTASLAGTATVTGLGSDVVSVTGVGTGAFADKNVANGKAVTVTGFSLTGADAGNYNVLQPSGLTATITAADLQISGVGAANKVYNGNTTASLTGAAAVTGIGADVVSVMGAGAGAFADKNVANSKAVTVTGFTLTGADAANYNVLQPTGLTANITQADLQVTGVGAANKVYNGNTAATLTGAASVSGLGADVVSVTGVGTGAFADKNVANGKAVTVTGFSLTGADAGNYNVLQPTGVLANITPAALSISGITASNKVYDGLTGATVSTAGVVKTGLIGGDDVTVSATGVFVNKDVANTKTVNLTSSYGGADAGNYTITGQATTVANITTAPLLITANNATKTFDGIDYAGGNGVSYGTFVNNETAAVLGGALTYGGTSQGATAAANYVITPSGLTSSNYAIAFANGVLTIDPASLTTTITGALQGTVAKVYNGTNVATLSGANYSLTGWVGSDGADVTKTVGTYADKNVGNGKLVTVNLNAGDYTARGTTNLANYTLPTTITGSVGIITAANLQVTGVGAANKVYNGSTAATLTGAASVSGLGADVVSVTGVGTGAFADKNVANGKAVTVTGFSLTGADAGNYNVLQPTGVLANITPAPLLITANNATKIFDGIAYAGGNGVSYGAFVNNETAAVVGGALTYGGTSQGATAAANYVITPSGLTSSNYAISFANGVLTIKPPKEFATPKTTQTSTEMALAIGLNAQNPMVFAEKSNFSNNSGLTYQWPAINSVKLPDTTDAGFLSITVMLANESTTSAVAYEQDAETVTLRTAAKPLLSPVQDKVVFSRKLTEFLVASTSGKIVEFTGGMVNRRLVIIAPSDESKQLAKAEMNLVLAAAVVALGKETPIMIAKLEGVVFDLR